MHGSLQSRAYMAYAALRARPRDPIPLYGCPHPECAGVPDTTTHQIFACPMAQASLRWMIATWQAITQSEKPPPLSFAVLVADDHRVWKPATHLKLWQRLRVTTLYAIWNASKLARGGQPQTAAGIAAFVVHTLTKAIRQDWCRVQAADIGGLAALTAGQITSEWLRGRSPAMPRPQFQEFWCIRNVLCEISHTHTLRVHWTLVHPVPVPSTA